jgi:hypothetical protein
MTVSFTVRKRGMTPKVGLRLLNSIHRQGMHELGEAWRDRYRPLHFQNAAMSRYSYTPRQGERGRTGRSFARSYTGRKLRTKGHTRPLVWSGESEQITRTPNIEATAKRGTARVSVKMRAYTLNFRYPGSPIDMRAELTTVIPQESQELAAGLSKHLAMEYAGVNVQSSETVAIET